MPDISISDALDFAAWASGSVALLLILADSAVYGACEGRGEPRFWQMVACFASAVLFLLALAGKLVTRAATP